VIKEYSEKSPMARKVTRPSRSSRPWWAGGTASPRAPTNSSWPGDRHMITAGEGYLDPGGRRSP
jgi:hypothetical protein